MSDELEQLRARRDLFPLLEELEIVGRVRKQMLAEPVAALAVLDHALLARGVRNRAAFAITRWRALRERAGVSLLPELEPEREREACPVDLDALEQAWSREPSFAGELVLRLIAAALHAHGGYAALRASFERRRIDAA